MKTFFLLSILFGLAFGEVIQKYNVDVTINQSGTLDVVENISYNFGNIQRHGIYRDIPTTIKYKNKIIDLEFNNFRVSQNGNYAKYSKTILYSKANGKNIRLKIGSKDSYVSSLQRYQIGYTINKIVMPYTKEQDIISFNAIGTNWQVPILEANIYYHLPPSLSKENVQIKTFTGRYGSTSSKASLKWLDNYNFKVSAKELPPFNGVTIDLIFKSNTLAQSGANNTKTSLIDSLLKYLYILILIPIGLYLKRLFNQYIGFIDNRSIAPMYAPPKDITTLQAGLIIDTVADNKDYAAAILELGHKGYIKIEHYRDDQIVLYATNKDRSTLDKDLKSFLDAILPSSNSEYFILQKDEDEARYLRDIFKKTNDIVYDIGVEKGFFKERPYDSKKSFLIRAVAALLPFIIYFIYYTYTNFGSEGLALMLFPVMFSIAGITMLLQGSIVTTIFGFIFIISGFMPLVNNSQNIGINEIIFGPIGAMVALIAIVSYLYKRVGKYTQKGAYLKTELLGLQMFIKRVKKDEIAYRLKSDPLYLERLLPYAVLFGENKHWISLFSELNVEAPIWYDGNLAHLSSFDNAINSAATYSDSSSGGFGGVGGSSGGGGGGGGGGSW
jgi:uncharacterized membrane protein YgcG